VSSNRLVRRIGTQAAVDEIGHRDEGCGAAESACAGDECVELGVQSLGATVRGAVVEGVPDQRLEAGECFRHFREFGEAGPGDHSGEQGLPGGAVYVLFVGAAALIVAICSAATEGACGATISNYIVGMSAGAAASVGQCWSSGSCHSGSDYAQAALEGAVAGGLGTWLGRVGIRGAAATRFKGNFLKVANKLLSKIRHWRL
jgi:hypothetical protein